MPQVPVTPSREDVLAKIPDYAVAISPAIGTVTVSYRGEAIARSDKALLIEETKHTAVFYLPPEDVRMALLEPSEHSTYCPFKGHASYWNLKLNDLLEENLVWSYKDPYPEVAGLKGYLSFYTDRTTVTTNGNNS